MKGVLLINLGTPKSPEPQDVREYLNEFLMDPYVIDIPFIFRWLLVKFILRSRPQLSSQAYKKIWTERGSPLLFHTQDLQRKLRNELKENYRVEFAMRYGNPSIESAIEKLEKFELDEVLVIPLYPQYSWAATESCIQKVRQFNNKVRIIQNFYKEDFFINSFHKNIKESLDHFKADHVLFSFHGVPERQIKRAGSKGNYKEQSYATARLLAQKLELNSSQWSVSFQSRLGRAKWIEPYTDVLLQELPKRGVKKLLVCSPSFVADCLETLEEIQIRGRDDFIKSGGEDLKLVPSLNANDFWINQLVNFLRGNL